MIVLTLITIFYYVNMDVNKLRDNFINVHCDGRITQKRYRIKSRSYLFNAHEIANYQTKYFNKSF